MLCFLERKLLSNVREFTEITIEGFLDLQRQLTVTVNSIGK